MPKYQFTEDMQEISGFGGTYEECCRKMLAAALEWLDDHPEANPQFHGFKNIYGIICDDNEDAKALSKVAIDAAGEYGATGAMHQAVISAVLWVKANGWRAYVKQMTHPEGQLGILKDKLERKQKDLDQSRKRLEELQTDNWKRGAIIADKVLGWKLHKTDNGQQEAYGPDQATVLERLGPGSSLHRLVDEAIDAMQVAV